MEYLSKIRKPGSLSVSKKALYSLAIFVLGIALGVIAKALDMVSGNQLPAFLGRLNLGNFLSRMGVWMFLGVCISLYSKTPLRAAGNSFLFFAGMVGSYYLYTVKVAGFFPKSYMMIWIGMTILSPFLAVVCWYAKGSHAVSIGIASIVFMLMTRQAFYFGFWYFGIRHLLELLLWAATLLVLYQRPKQLAWVVGIGAVLFFATSQWNLFGGMM